MTGQGDRARWMTEQCGDRAVWVTGHCDRALWVTGHCDRGPSPGGLCLGVQMPQLVPVLPLPCLCGTAPVCTGLQGCGTGHKL